MIPSFTIIALSVAFFAAALLYASVGNAGASAYLAIMAIFSLAPAVMKPTALALNILVASFATLHFARAHSFSWPVFWPFALTSIPFSFLGGRILLPGVIYKPLVGIVLLYVAYRLFRSASQGKLPAGKHPMPLGLALAAGAGIGFLAGLIGLGGGIFLTPLLLFTGWAEPRQAAGASAVFNLVNSLAGLFGQVTILANLPIAILPWAFAAASGGWIGAIYGSRRLGNARLQQALGLVLLVAGLKIMLI
jgi:uncharacterized membrane protein YfcA